MQVLTVPKLRDYGLPSARFVVAAAPKRSDAATMVLPRMPNCAPRL